MNVNKNSLFIRWTYYLNTGHRPPHQTSLCAIFWRGCVLMPLFASLALVGLSTIGYAFTMKFCPWIWHWIISHMRVAAWSVTLGVTIGVIASFILYVARNTEVVERLGEVADELSSFIGKKFVSINESIFFKGLKAIKAKVCPIIWIE